MERVWSARLEREVNFRCEVCKHAWEALPDLIEDAPEQEWHPFAYFAHCPACKEENQPQAAWARALLKAHQSCTGPKSAEGLAKVSQNLVGHPTPEEALRTRFNAMKHGMSAKVATYFPAKPGGYAFCSTCEVDRAWCAGQSACTQQTELFLLHHAAFEQRDPRKLQGIHAGIAASVTAMIQTLIQQAIADGLVLRQPKVELNREGHSVTLTYLDVDGTRKHILDYHTHPALTQINNLMKTLGLTMGELGMTVRDAEPDEADAGGRLKGEGKDSEALIDFGARMLEQMGLAKGMLERANAKTAADPVLVEHRAREGQSGGGGAARAAA